MWSQKLCVCNKIIHQEVLNFKQLKYESIIHNTTSSIEKVIWSESGEKSAQIKHRLPVKTALKKCVDFDARDNRRWTFSLDEALLWIMDSYLVLKRRLEVKNLLMMDTFCINTQLLSSQDVNWWTGWCGLLWCFYQLFGLSFWRHPFTAEHPLLSKWCNATFLQIWWRNKLIYILDNLRVRTFLASVFIFGWSVALTKYIHQH